MASLAGLVVPYGFSVLLFCCPQLLGAVTIAQASHPQWDLERLAATALVPSVLLTLLLTPLLSFALVMSALGRGGGGGGAAGGRRRLVTGLAKATVLAATVALVACVLLQQLGADGGAAAAAVVQLGADGHLDRGRDDVARLNIK